MKKVFKLITVVLTVALLAIGVCACGGSEGGNSDSKDDVLAGTWTREDEFYGEITLTFDGNGNASWGYDAAGVTYNDEGTYKIQDETIVLIKMNRWDDEIDGMYKVDGDTLTLSACGGLDGTYTKK